MENIINKHIAVWFSSGAASAVAAKLTLDLYGDANKISIINNPIKEEDKDNIRFLNDVQKWLGVEIQFALNPKYPAHSCVDVWDDRQFMSGPLGAPCTSELKKVARQHWELTHKPDYTVLGFTSEEQGRADRFRLSERDTLLTPLIECGYDKQACFNTLHAAGIEVPRAYKLGYVNSNCTGCVKATSPTYWNHVRKMDPDTFLARAKQSREIGAKLVRVNNKRIFLDELSPSQSGRPMKSYDFECGIFCEELADATE